MGKFHHVNLTDFFKASALEAKRRVVYDGYPRFLDDIEPDAPDDDLALFADYDTPRKARAGFYSEDARECASRRLDMRGPLDFDPGPVEMEEAPGEVEGVWLDFRGARKSA